MPEAESPRILVVEDETLVRMAMVDALEAFFVSGNLPLGKSDDAGEIASAELLEDRVQQALAVLREVRGLWQQWMANLDVVQAETGRTVFADLQDHTLRASWKTQIRSALQSIFAGAALEPIVAECQKIHDRVLKGRVWVALHMHAGDGNVHTNIPVNSDDYEMLQTAHEAVDRIMVLARSLDGVISGEHGIGITKLEYLTDEELKPFADYKAKVDPEGRFNKGKLLRQTMAGAHRADLAHAYTYEAAMVDLRNLHRNTKDGLHMASLAGTWTALVRGFGGLRDDEGILALDPSAARHDTREHIEITNADAVQVSLYPEEAAITVPYWHEGERAAAVMARMQEYAALLTEQGGFSFYDPQTGETVTGPGANDAYAYGVEATQRIAEKYAADPPPAPKRRRWWPF